MFTIDLAGLQRVAIQRGPVFLSPGISDSSNNTEVTYIIAKGLDSLQRNYIHPNLYMDIDC